MKTIRRTIVLLLAVLLLAIMETALFGGRLVRRGASRFGPEVMGDGARQVAGAAVEGVKTTAGDAARRSGGLLGRGKTHAAAKASP